MAVSFFVMTVLVFGIIDSGFFLVIKESKHVRRDGNRFFKNCVTESDFYKYIIQ